MVKISAASISNKWELEAKRLAKESRKLAKRANQRMVRAELYSKRPKHKKIKEYSYAKAQKDIANIKKMIGRPVKEAQNRFIESSNIPKEFGEDYKAAAKFFRIQIAAEKEFLDSVSSTIGRAMSSIESEHRKMDKQGLDWLYDQRVRTINEKYGTNFTSEELKRFFDSRKQSKLQQRFGSDQMFNIADQMINIPTTKRQLKKFFDEHKVVNMKVDEKDYKDAKDMYSQLKDFMTISDDPVLDEYVAQAYAEGFNAKMIFNLFI